MSEDIKVLNKKARCPTGVIELSDGRKLGVVEWHPHIVFGQPVKITAELIVMRGKDDEIREMFEQQELLASKFGECGKEQPEKSTTDACGSGGGSTDFPIEFGRLP